MLYDGASLVLRTASATFGCDRAVGDRPSSAASAGDRSPTSRCRCRRRRRLTSRSSRHPAGSLFAAHPRRRSGRENLVFLAHSRLLDALHAGADLPEPAPALQALPHHHGDPQRLHARPHRRPAACPHGRIEREAHGDGGRSRRGARPPPPPSASRASSTSPGRRSSTSTPAPSAAAARTTAPPTGRARS